MKMQEEFIKKAIEIALENIDKGGGPFGALIVKNNEIISSSGNRVTLNNDPTAHAEIIAIREASAKLKTWDLSDCVLYTSCEPCPMCLGAVYWAHISRVFYACSQSDAGDAGFDDSFIYKELNLKVSQRKLPMTEINRSEGLSVFKKWNNFPGKTKY